MSKQESGGKASYSQPKLIVYGGFAHLTAAGSANRPENDGFPSSQTGMRA